MSLLRKQETQDGQGSLRRVYSCLEMTAEGLFVELGWGEGWKETQTTLETC